MKNKKKTIILLVISLVIALLLGTGGLFTYKYFELKNSKDEQKTELSNNQKQEENNQPNNQVEEKKELNTKEKYENFITYYKKNKKSNKRNIVQTTIDGDYEITAFDGTILISYKNSCKECYGYEMINDNGGDIAIAEKTISYELINTGQADIYTLYFINEDGTVGKADIEIANENKKPTIAKNISGLNYIVKIVQTSYTDNNGGGMVGPLFIDINGNMYNEQGNLLN